VRREEESGYSWKWEVGNKTESASSFFVIIILNCVLFYIHWLMPPMCNCTNTKSQTRCFVFQGNIKNLKISIGSFYRTDLWLLVLEIWKEAYMGDILVLKNTPCVWEEERGMKVENLFCFDLFCLWCVLVLVVVGHGVTLFYSTLFLFIPFFICFLFEIVFFFFAIFLSIYPIDLV
jgi:hypothetical protein